MTQKIRLVNGWGDSFTWPQDKVKRKLLKLLSENTDTRIIIFGPFEHDHLFNQLHQTCDTTHDGKPRIFELVRELQIIKNKRNNTLEWVKGSTGGASHFIHTHTDRFIRDNLVAQDYTFVGQQHLYDRVHNWDTFWMEYGLDAISNIDIFKRVHDYRKNAVITDYTYMFVSRCGHVHQHRCCLMDYLYHFKLMHRNLLTFGGTPNANPAEMFNNQYVWKYWKNPEPIKWHEENPDNLDIHGGPLAVEAEKAWLEIVSESCVNSLFLTEKTVKPLVNLKPFVIQGARGQHQALADLGFELYDEIFDYSFDNLLDYRERTHSIVHQMRNIQMAMQSDWEYMEEINQLLKQKAMRNLKRLCEIVIRPLRDHGVQEILLAWPDIIDDDEKKSLESQEQQREFSAQFAQQILDFLDTE